MEFKRDKIEMSTMLAFAVALQSAVPGLTGETLLKAIENYEPRKEGEEQDENSSLKRPMRIKDTADFLGVSIPTVQRLLNKGMLRRVKLSSRLVMVDGESIRNLLKGRKDKIKGVREGGYKED